MGFKNPADNMRQLFIRDRLPAKTLLLILSVPSLTKKACLNFSRLANEQ